MRPYLPDSALHCLKDLRIKSAGIPMSEIHAGTVNRLISIHAATAIDKPSPHDRGLTISWMVITDAGRRELAARGI